MKRSTLFRHIRKGMFLLFALALLAGYSVHDVFSHYTGVDVEGSAWEGGCAYTIGCHVTPADPSTVIHLFMPTKIYADSTYTLRISVSNPNPEDVAAGFDVDVFPPAVLDTIAGMNTFASAPFLNFIPGSVTHSMPQSFKGDSAVWSFLYTARPTAGIDTLYVAGNAVNGDSAIANDSDRWNSDTIYINVLSAPSGVAPSSPASSIQIYPNPASNEIFINDGIPANAGSYTLTDPAGRVVLFGHQILLDGNHSIDISSIIPGAYILNVQPRSGQSFSRKIIVQR